MTDVVAPPTLEFEDGDSHRVDLVHVTGPDAKAFLDSQVSQDLGRLDDGGSAWSLLLEPDGHLGALVQVVQLATEHLVVLGAQGSSVALDVEGILARLQRFKIRVKADLGVAGAARCVGEGPLGLPERLPGVAEHLIVDMELLDGKGDSVGHKAVFEGRVISETAPIGLTPAGLGASVLEQAASFTKGCYTGQELVARMDARVATPPRRVVRIAGEAPQISPAPSLEGLEGASLVEVVFDPVTERFGGVVEIPRKIETLEGLAVTLDGHPAEVMESPSGTVR